MTATANGNADLGYADRGSRNGDGRTNSKNAISESQCIGRVAKTITRDMYTRHATDHGSYHVSMDNARLMRVTPSPRYINHRCGEFLPIPIPIHLRELSQSHSAVVNDDRRDADPNAGDPQFRTSQRSERREGQSKLELYCLPNPISTDTCGTHLLPRSQGALEDVCLASSFMLPHRLPRPF